MIRVGINGIGRIGKLVFRLVHEHPNMSVAAINDTMPAATLVHLLKYDSVHRGFGRAVTVSPDNGRIRVNGQEIIKYEEHAPARIPWDAHNVDVVIDASGRFLTRKELQDHLKSGVKRVILSCPPKDQLDMMVVIGVNDQELKPEHRIISNASCTTNCIAPVIKVLQDYAGIDRAFMNTVHPYTNSQNLLDAPHADMRRARSAAENIIPTTTSAIKAVQTLFPALKGSFDGFASRVPVSDGSFVELNAIIKKEVTASELNLRFQQAAREEMSGIIEYCEDPIVSKDVIGNPHSAIFDALCTKVLGNNFIQVLAWYDNEFAYSNRVVELIARSEL